MNPKLKEKILESLSAVLPITFIVLAVSVFLVPMDTGTVVMFFVGALMLIVGMGMFQLGAEMAMSPLGEGVGVEIAKRKRAIVILPVSFLMGALITLAEPDLQVLSNQVPSIPNSTLIVTVAVGVGIFLALAVVRIVLKVSLSVLLTGLYACLLALSFFVPKDFLPVAFDSGGHHRPNHGSLYYGYGRGPLLCPGRQKRFQRQLWPRGLVQRGACSGSTAFRLFFQSSRSRLCRRGFGRG